MVVHEAAETTGRWFASDAENLDIAAAVCRAPAPVIAYVEHSTSDEASSAAQPKNGRAVASACYWRTEQRLPHDDVVVGTVPPPRVIGAVENVLSRLEEGAASSSESATTVSSRGSRRTKTPGRSRRRLKPRRDASPSPDPTESVCIIEYVDGVPSHTRAIEVAGPHRDAKSITSLPGRSWKILRDLKAGDIEQVCLITDAESVLRVINSIELSDASSRPKSAEPTSAREERFAAQSWEALKASGNPVYETAREFADVFTDKIPAVLPADRGIHHEIDLAPGAKYCVTRQWPLPRDQVKAIDEFFVGRRQAGHVREGTSPHLSPTFRVKKSTGVWRIVHAFNKLNDATIPAQTPIPRKDTVLDSMPGSVIFSAIDLTDGFYQILMRESAIPLTAVSTPSEVHIWHLMQVFQVMRENKLYANLKKCVSCAPETPVLGCYVSKNGVRTDPEKVSSICLWPTNPTELRHWLGLANYLHKYTKDYAGLIQSLSSLLKKDATWSWHPEHQTSFDSVEKSLASAPILMLPADSKPFHVVCDASDFAIGCALMQFDDEGHERVVSYQSRQIKPAERNYPVHDKELLAMRYALIKFRMYLLDEQTFAVYTDHASLHQAMKSPHLSLLSRRPDCDPRVVLGRQVIDDEDDSDEHCAVCAASGINLTSVSPEMDLRDEIAAVYADDAFYASILA
ncbi:unnamed protein product [Phytophthora fragariaefolia]|uniref:Unnamed protein product n=1 Tax=Phytophthora fragariaefolia TaxID=1490495 RepID=A0A9W6WZM2_9STRA|nr:unnamed protein product [Phytophthora fragariaefolia]